MLDAAAIPCLIFTCSENKRGDRSLDAIQEPRFKLWRYMCVLNKQALR
jgi:hypothetical protein